MKLIPLCFLLSAELAFWLTVFHRCPCALGFVIAVVASCVGLVVVGWLLGGWWRERGAS